MAAQSTGAEEMLAELEGAAAGEMPGEAQPGKPETTKTSGKEQPKNDREGWIPKARLDEVIQARNERDQTISELSAKVKESDASIARLTKMLEGSQSAVDTIAQLRELANDPKHRPHVEYLHKVLVGEETEEALPENATEQQKADHQLRELARAQEQLQASLVDQRADQIIQRADLIADKWLDALPEEYTAEDRNAIAHLWTSRVDWNSIEGNPSGLEKFLADSFQDTLNIYGIPRGHLYSQDEVDELQNQQSGEASKALPSPEEELESLFTSKNYSGFKGTGRKNSAGQEIVEPEVSEDDFAADLAKAMKIANAARGRK